MTNKELIALGASINQLTVIIENIDTLRKNLIFCGFIKEEGDGQFWESYFNFTDIQFNLESFIKEQTKNDASK